MHGGNVFEVSKKYKIKFNKIIDFSVNLNPIGLHPGIIKNITKNLSTISYYPDNTYNVLKKNFEIQYKINDDYILPGNGSVELIYLFASAMQFKNSLIIDPNFSEYKKALENTKCKITNIIGKEENHFKFPIDQIIKKKSAFEIIFLSNPNNPAGYIYEKEELIELLKFCKKKKCYLFIDEVFLDFVNDKEKFTLTDLIKENEYLVILKSMTKFYSMPGMRLGSILANKNIINKLKKFQVPWSINNFSATFPKKIINDKKFILKTIDYLNKEKIFLFKGLSEINEIKIFPSSANFFLLKILNKKSADELQDFLINKNILIRNCSNFLGLNNKFFRIGVKKRNKNKLLLNNLKRFFNN